MGHRHVVVVQNIIQNQVINVTFVAGDQDKGALEGLLLNPHENAIIYRDAVEHIARYPPHDDRCNLYEGRLIIGSDFFQVSIGLAVNLVNRNIAGFSIFLHEFLQAIIGQNAFFQLFFGLADRSGDALAVTVELNQQVFAQHQRL